MSRMPVIWHASRSALSAGVTAISNFSRSKKTTHNPIPMNNTLIPDQHSKRTAGLADDAALFDESDDAELVTHGRLIREWQEAQTPKITDVAMTNRHPELGSTKTYKRIRTGDTEELTIADWLPKYRLVWQRIQDTDLELGTEPVYNDLSPATRARECAVRLFQQAPRSNQRWVLIEGNTGTGKSFALRAVKDAYGKKAYLVEAHEGWKRLGTALRYFAEALNIRPGDQEARPQSAGDWLELIIAKLNARGRRLILIDEAHHWGGEMLNVLKTLINRTDCVFVVAAVDTIWSGVTSSRWAEAKQLIFNRMLKKETLGAPTKEDVMLYLSRRCDVAPSARVINHVIGTARGKGSLAFVRRVAAKLSSEGADDENVIEAVTQSLIDLGEEVAA